MATSERTFTAARTNRRGIFLPFRYLAAFLIGGAAIALVVFYLLHQTATEKGTAALVKATSEYRSVEARLSGGFRAGKLISDPADSREMDQIELQRARNYILEMPFEKQGPYAHLAVGKLKLIEGNIKEAKSEIETATEAMPKSAEACNDLGVIFLESGNLEDALERFEQALAIKPQMAEARFNRALCYEKLQLRDMAEKEYSSIEATELDQGWKAEIHQRLEDLSQPFAPKPGKLEILKAFHSAIVANDIDAARKIIDEHFEFIFAYANKRLSEAIKGAKATGPAEIERALSEVEIIGQLSIETKGDTAIADNVKFLRNLSEKDRAAQYSLIAEFWSVGVSYFESKVASDQAAAIKRIRDFYSSFRQTKNYLYQYRALGVLIPYYYYNNKFQEAFEVDNDCLSSLAEHASFYQKGWMLGHLSGICSRLGHDSLAIKYGEEGRKIFADIREKAEEGKVLQYMCNSYSQLGNLDKVLSYLRESINLTLASMPNPQELAWDYQTIAESYQLRGNHDLALSYADQALKFSEMAKDSNRAAQALSFIAAEQSHLERFDEAARSMNQALDNVAKFAPGQNTFARRIVPTRAGEIAARRGDYDAAVAYYNDAERVSEGNQSDLVLTIDTLRGRAGAYAALGKIALAQADLDHAVDLVENYRAGIEQNQDRSSFLGAIQGVFDQMIMIEMSQVGQQREAYNHSEQSRARTLLDDIAIKPLSLTEVQANLPADLTVVEYVVTDQQTYIFLITSHGFEVVSTPVTTEIITRLVSDYLSGLKGREPIEALSEKGRTLYSYLIEPIRGSLNGSERLCIVPDKSLHFLPFGALINSEGEYLIDSFSLTYAPSATVLANCLKERQIKPEIKEESILAVGNPTFDRNVFTGLPLLPSAEVEAKQVASFYRNKKMLLGAEATESEVLKQMKDFDVLHLATHCLVEERSPWLAGLVFAEPDTQSSNTNKGGDVAATINGLSSFNDGFLQLRELRGIKLSRTHLVVLSACQSGLGQYYRGEGIVSLVRPFLAAQVPTVMASLWPVDSQATSELMIAFHEERTSANKQTDDALRAAQRRIKAESNYQHPYYWAPFITIGSGR